jgi:hypothetical protein
MRREIGGSLVVELPHYIPEILESIIRGGQKIVYNNLCQSGKKNRLAKVLVYYSTVVKERDLLSNVTFSR